jgi:ABC-type dipeptide/oligopeptide/nickel transport system ATPase component
MSFIGLVVKPPMPSWGILSNEGIGANKGISKQQGRAEAERLLELVRIPGAKNLLNAYPYELSGGMRQRVMFAIAIALCRSPYPLVR